MTEYLQYVYPQTWSNIYNIYTLKHDQISTLQCTSTFVPSCMIKCDLFIKYDVIMERMYKQ
jgi:hypothetical protein